MCTYVYIHTYIICIHCWGLKLRWKIKMLLNFQKVSLAGQVHLGRDAIATE